MMLMVWILAAVFQERFGNGFILDDGVFTRVELGDTITFLLSRLQSKMMTKERGVGGYHGPTGQMNLIHHDLFSLGNAQCRGLF